MRTIEEEARIYYTHFYKRFQTHPIRLIEVSFILNISIVQYRLMLSFNVKYILFNQVLKKINSDDVLRQMENNINIMCEPYLLSVGGGMD